MNESVEDFITIYPKMVGMEMGLYVPLSYAWEPAPVYSWLLLPHKFSIRFYKVHTSGFKVKFNKEKEDREEPETEEV